MFCQACGKQIPDTAKFCEFCGKPTASTTPPPSVAQPSPPPPATTPPAAAVRPATPSAPGPAMAVKTSGLAIASLVFGLLSILFSFLAGIPAVVFGHLARSDIQKSGGRVKGSGMALAGLILGYLFGVAVVPILIIAAIAIPNLLRARTAANEASAVGSLRDIVTAAVNYSYTCPKVGFPPSLAAIGPTPSPSEPCPEGANLIDSVLASGTKSGYVFTYVPRDMDGNGTFDTYTLTADPVKPGNTGRRYFFTDESGVVRSETNSPANASSPPLG